jgi:hypothetical protein
VANTLTRRFGSVTADRLLRGTGVIALLAIPLTLLWPVVAPLTAFLLVTVWVHGPASPFLPAAYEPVLLLFGRVYPPLLIGLLGTLGDLYVEYLDYQLFLGLGAFGPYRTLLKHPLFTRAVALFNRRPFLAVWLFAWSPLPDWMIRMIAPAARYPVRRYLLAMGLGRLPKFWLLAAVGARWQPDRRLVVAVVAGSMVLTAGMFLGRQVLSRLRSSLPAQPSPLTSAGVATASGPLRLATEKPTGRPQCGYCS